ncbi:4-alpha-glucanotransferase family protein, partial [Vibrio parahaemolyticus EKP-028]
VTHIG